MYSAIPACAGRDQVEQKIFRGSSVVERSAVNRLVVGSNPTRGAKISLDKIQMSFDGTIFALCLNSHMRITSGFRKLMPSILGGALGISLIIYGGNDDSPGAQLLGLVIFIVSMTIMVRTRRKITCDIESN